MDNYIKKILYLGPEGSNSQLAAGVFENKLKINTEMIPVSTITKAIEILDSEDDSTAAVLPIENSIEGIVRETIDNLIQTGADVFIQAEITVPICHCLIAKGKKEEIKTIVSITQAVAQCKKYIADNFPKDIGIILYSSTSGAAKYIKDKDNSFASISNELCAGLYGLNVIEKDINDVKDNKTRFILVAKKNLCKEKKSRTSISFTTENKPGALLKILEIFKNNNLNLIYLESRPSKKKFGEYIFYADIDKGFEDIKEVLEEVNKNCGYYRLLGSYCIL
ncbi:TPA: prephenate dehydratase [Candidatus Galligastranaerophilus gallistercoris]|nr:prephenate dehydratase [Candidatus Galligastranaerophilus gallistercoris]